MGYNITAANSKPISMRDVIRIGGDTKVAAFMGGVTKHISVFFTKWQRNQKLAMNGGKLIGVGMCVELNSSGFKQLRPCWLLPGMCVLNCRWHDPVVDYYVIRLQGASSLRMQKETRYLYLWRK